jgi:hypothetical protein
MIDKVANSFGAKINLQIPQSNQHQTFLVKSAYSQVNLPALISSQGGQILIDGRVWVIAQLMFHQAMELRKLREIAFVGGITLDPQRFTAFSQPLENSQGSSYN